MQWFLYLCIVIQHYTSNTLLNSPCRLLLPPQNPSQCLQSCLQRLTCPRRAASLCSDAWPLPLGSWLALQQGSRGRAKEGKGWRREQREEEAREQYTKFHLFWVGWLIFLPGESSFESNLCLLPTVSQSPLWGQKKRQMADKLTVGQVMAGLTCVGTGFVWLKKGQE